jgi:ethanolamine transporter
MEFKESTAMNQWIMGVFAIGALLGGVDYLFGNRKGYGEQFAAAFSLLGPTAMSMAGIICLTPVLSFLFCAGIRPLFHMVGIDPAMAGGVFAIDMGGYQLCMQIADDPFWGAYAGILVGSTLGCTIMFTLPVGMGVIEKSDEAFFLQGILIGLIGMPFGLFFAGLLLGASLGILLYELLPVFLFAILLIIGLRKIPAQMVWIFQKFAAGMKILITIGLIIGAVFYMTGQSSTWITPLTDAMSVVVSICIVMLGSLPVSLFLQRLCKKPLQALGKKCGLDNVAMTALMMGTVSVIPALLLLRDTNQRGKIAVTAYLVSAASLMGAHIAFTAGTEASMIGPLILAKLTGGVAALLISVAVSSGIHKE